MTGYITEFAAALDLLLLIMARHGKGAAIQRIQVENEYRDAVKRYGSIVKAATAMRAERGELMGE